VESFVTPISKEVRDIHSHFFFPLVAGAGVALGASFFASTLAGFAGSAGGFSEVLA